MDLLQKINALNPEQISSRQEWPQRKSLSLIHDPNYIEAVKKAGNGQLPAEIAENYGIGTEDTPIFPNMHEASSLLVGGH